MAITCVTSAEGIPRVVSRLIKAVASVLRRLVKEETNGILVDVVRFATDGTKVVGGPSITIGFCPCATPPKPEHAR